MTIEEAIKWLKEDKELYETDICHAGDGTTDGELLESLDMAISSLERRIPKKPKRNNTIASKFFHRTSCYTCPTCGNGLLTKWMNERQNTRYCWDCGQRLDWGEGE